MSSCVSRVPRSPADHAEGHGGLPHRLAGGVLRGPRHAEGADKPRRISPLASTAGSRRSRTA
eukprot:1765344-Alexandrium_andersonii.AAC.1